MRIGLRFLASLLLVSFGGSLLPESRSHCSPTGESVSAPESHSHRGTAHLGIAHHDPAPATSIAAQGDHECGHCPPADCRTPEHCAAGATVGPSAAAPALHLAASWVRLSARPSDRPLSANPTPPIPPPQVLL